MQAKWRGTVAPHVCLSWPKIVKNCLSRPDVLALPLLNGLRGPCNRSLKYVLRAVSLSSFTRQFVCGIFLCVQSVICKGIFSENERGFKMILQPLNKITCTYTGKIN